MQLVIKISTLKSLCGTVGFYVFNVLSCLVADRLDLFFLRTGDIQLSFDYALELILQPSLIV